MITNQYGNFVFTKHGVHRFMFLKNLINVNVTETHSGIFLHLCVTYTPTYITVTECLR